MQQTRESHQNSKRVTIYESIVQKLMEKKHKNSNHGNHGHELEKDQGE